MLSEEQKQLKYAARIGRKYDHDLFWAELRAIATRNAQPCNRYAYISAKYEDDEWQFYPHRTALAALKHSGLNARYFEAYRHYSALITVSHRMMLQYAEAKC